MILPPEDVTRNRLSRKSRQKALERGQGRKGKKTQKKRPVPPKPSQESASKGGRGGRAIPTTPSLDQREEHRLALRQGLELYELYLQKLAQPLGLDLVSLATAE